ncbi:MAG: ABC transporter permease [Blastocatellia bacterium]
MSVHYQAGEKMPLWRPALGLLGEHRGLIRSMVRRELTSRYKGSVMGIAWAVITPAVMIGIFTIIFAGIFNARFGENGGTLQFALYLFCGMLPWTAFSEPLQRATSAINDNASLVKRVVFPIEALPVNLALTALTHQLLGTTVLLAAALLFEQRLHATILYLPLLLIPQLLATIGLGWLLASLGVFIRDLPQFTQLFLSAWMYLTPIFFPEHLIPQNYLWLVRLNPLAPLIRSYRLIILEGKAPDWQGLGVTTGFAMICALVGYWWFIRTKKAFADII